MDWLDPLGLRGSRLDPFKMFTDALKGEGLAQQSAERIATGVAQGLVGRRVEVDHDPPVSFTVDAVHELAPATALAAVPSTDGVIPMWQRFRARLSDVAVGDARIESVEIDAVGLRLVGTGARRMQIGRVDAVGIVTAEKLGGWLEQLDLPYVVRLADGRLEVADRRFQRWVGVSIDITAAAQEVTVQTGEVRLLGRRFLPPSWLRRTERRPAPWLPIGAEIVRLEATDDDRLEFVAAIEEVEVPVDISKLLVDLGAGGTRSVLRIVTGLR